MNSGEIELYRYRWVNLCLFCLSSGVNYIQFSQYTIIGNIVKDYYKIENNTLVDLTGLIFPISYVVFLIPVNYSINRFTSVVLCIFFTTAGNLLKLLSVSPDRFYVVMLGQLLCGVGQVFSTNLPTKMANVWFGAKEVSTACSICIFGMNVGAAFGYYLPSAFVKSNQSVDKTGTDFMTMLGTNAGVTCAIFILVVLFFRSKPPLPPSQSQKQLKEGKVSAPVIKTLKTLLKNKNFTIPLLNFCFIDAVWMSFAIVSNSVYLNYFEDGESEIGLFNSISNIIGGCVGTYVLGLILDNTRHFKSISVGIFSLSTLSLVTVFITLELNLRVGCYITVPLFGSIMNLPYILALEYLTEVSHPLAEQNLCAIFGVLGCIMTNIMTLIIENLFDSIGYLYTYCLVCAAMIITTLSFFTVSVQLNRRNINVLVPQI